MREGSTTAAREQVDAVHSVLSDGERRGIVRILATEGTPMGVSTLADRIAGNRDVTAVHVRLYHQHLPRMDQAGVVEHDRERGQVSLTPEGGQAAAMAARTAELFGGEPSRSE